MFLSPKLFSTRLHPPVRRGSGSSPRHPPPTHTILSPHLSFFLALASGSCSPRLPFRHDSLPHTRHSSAAVARELVCSSHGGCRELEGMGSSATGCSGPPCHPDKPAWGLQPQAVAALPGTTTERTGDARKCKDFAHRWRLTGRSGRHA